MDLAKPKRPASAIHDSITGPGLAETMKVSVINSQSCSNDMGEVLASRIGTQCNRAAGSDGKVSYTQVWAKCLVN